MIFIRAGRGAVHRLRGLVGAVQRDDLRACLVAGPGIAFERGRPEVAQIAARVVDRKSLVDGVDDPVGLQDLDPPLVGVDAVLGDDARAGRSRPWRAPPAVRHSRSTPCGRPAPAAAETTASRPARRTARATPRRNAGTTRAASRVHKDRRPGSTPASNRAGRSVRLAFTSGASSRMTSRQLGEAARR